MAVLDAEQRAVGMAEDVPAVLAHELVLDPFQRGARMRAGVDIAVDPLVLPHDHDLERVRAVAEGEALAFAVLDPVEPAQHPAAGAGRGAHASVSPMAV